ncbi:MAG: hypothetical protein COU69_00100 [Candidatus Pacebacteria bacterium CG10_big_fil_rev_8_21_14_0_10_56_10]|nr:MAG: hypothetical protein COU69_00100 [Candidatus Pacebacteria bacterium CG10_big_fil_rev_8_21_14_0_10_56_10]
MARRTNLSARLSRWWRAELLAHSSRWWQVAALVGILLFALVTRLWRLHLPERYIFDEVYHAATAKLVAAGDPQAYEWWAPRPEPGAAVDWLHPPLAKYTQATAMRLVGQTSFGWRLSSALFGVGVIGLVYLLGRDTLGVRVGLLAAALASLDGLLLVQSRLAMNDIHVTFFILLTLWLYWRFRQTLSVTDLVLTGVAAGLAIASKWSGVFGLVVVGLFEVWRLVRDSRGGLAGGQLVGRLRRAGLAVAALVIMPAVVYVASFSQMFLQGKTLLCPSQSRSTLGSPTVLLTGSCYQRRLSLGPLRLARLSHFGELHYQIWQYQTNLTATHPYQSRPWQWFLNLRPVWYSVERPSAGSLGQPGTVSNIYALGNPVVLWLGATAALGSGGWLTMGWLDRLKARGPTGRAGAAHPQLVPLTFILISYLAVWLPWSLSPRIMFFYHYTPAVPLLTLLLAWAVLELSRLHRPATSWLVLAVLGLSLTAFVLFLPHWTGWPVPVWWADAVYFALPSWR